MLSAMLALLVMLTATAVRIVSSTVKLESPVTPKERFDHGAIITSICTVLLKEGSRSLVTEKVNGGSETCLAISHHAESKLAKWFGTNNSLLGRSMIEIGSGTVRASTEKPGSLRLCCGR